MISSKVLVSFVLFLFSPMIIKCNHFNGGTITWTPVDPYTNSPSVVVTITQTYFWVLTAVDCKPNVPITTAGRENQGRNLTCVANCTTDGGYSTNPLNILTDCVTSNSFVNVMKSQASKNITITNGAYFSIAYTDGYWRSAQNSVVGDWSIAAYIDLRKRPDGIINTPPVSTIQSPQYVLPNRTTHIKIPVYDVNLGDNLRCRWAQNPGLNGVDECDSLCNSNQLPNGTNLTDCVLTFVSTIEDTWYGFTLQIEDFLNSTSTTPMSSIPVQFLIYVLANVTCLEEPVILPLTDCLEVQVGVTIVYTLYAINYCNESKIQITDISSSKNILGMNVSEVFNSTTNSSLTYVSLNWIPQMSQLGSQQFCAIAYTNEKVQSAEYCVNFKVKTGSDLCGVTTTITTEATPNKIDIPLIVGLSLLALLLGICCCCCLWWYYYYCLTAARRRQQHDDKNNHRRELVSTFHGQNIDRDHLNEVFTEMIDIRNDRPYLSGKDSLHKRSVSSIIKDRKTSSRVISVNIQEKSVGEKRLTSLLVNKPKSSIHLPPSTENSELDGSSVHVQRITTGTHPILRKKQRKQSGSIHVQMKKTKRSNKKRSIHPN